LVVGFTTIGYRHGGAMKIRGDNCVAPGMRDTDANCIFERKSTKVDNLWNDFEKLPWASEQSTNAKVVKDALLSDAPG
jgi:hypothetical protein